MNIRQLKIESVLQEISHHCIRLILLLFVCILIMIIKVWNGRLHIRIQGSTTIEDYYPL